MNAEILNIGVSYIIKNIIKRPRPCDCLKDTWWLTPTTADPYSFPSAHTSSSFTMATMIALRYPDKPFIYAPMFTLSMLVGYGRIYLGKHFPLDAFTGMLIGSLSSVLVYSLRVELLKLKNKILVKKGKATKMRMSNQAVQYWEVLS